MAVHALEAPGSGGRSSPAEGREPNLNASLTQANVMPGIHPPAKGLVAFTGSGRATARHLTERQGHKRLTGLQHAAGTSVQDTAHKLLGTEYVGTDRVFRLHGARVEAFSGVDLALFRLLASDVEEYRAVVRAGRDTRPRLTFDKS
ncbi:hypothetical protein ACFY8P_21050 [Streptomyces sp. NPDC012693]|jgi:hypothetical protein|uniref:hypothetical protein n=1 Tax=Streptomyces sp. NPDC012693 TaxID=3364844 RepID=UPI0036BC0712